MKDWHTLLYIDFVVFLNYPLPKKSSKYTRPFIKTIFLCSVFRGKINSENDLIQCFNRKMTSFKEYFPYLLLFQQFRVANHNTRVRSSQCIRKIFKSRFSGFTFPWSSFFQILYTVFFFLSGFSFTNIHESQDCRGRGRAFL